MEALGILKINGVEWGR